MDGKHTSDVIRAVLVVVFALLEGCGRFGHLLPVEHGGGMSATACVSVADPEPSQVRVTRGKPEIYDPGLAFHDRFIDVASRDWSARAYDMYWWHTAHFPVELTNTGSAPLELTAEDIEIRFISGKRERQGSIDEVYLYSASDQIETFWRFNTTYPAPSGVPVLKDHRLLIEAGSTRRLLVNCHMTMPTARMVTLRFRLRPAHGGAERGFEVQYSRS